MSVSVSSGNVVAVCGDTAMRAVERAYKRKREPLPREEAFSESRVSWETDRSGVWTSGSSSTAVQRIELKGRTAITFDSIPGFVLLSGYLEPHEQRNLVKACLRDGPRQPNSTSLDPHYTLPDEGLWQAFERRDEALIMPKTSHADRPVLAERTISRRVRNDLEPVLTGGERAAERAESVETAPSPNAKPSSAAQLLNKLRWACIGAQYHWTTKTYTDQSVPISSLIETTCNEIARNVPWLDVLSSHVEEATLRRWTEYCCDAGIINVCEAQQSPLTFQYYSVADSLTAHIDHSEVDATSPLVSISLGLDAVFLIGGATRDVEPLPILLRSGDALIMSGPCRRFFHSLPRVYDQPSTALEAGAEADDEWTHGGFSSYMRKHRINLNVRRLGSS